MEQYEKDMHTARRYLAKAQQARDRGIAFKLSLTSYRNLMSAKYCYYTGIELSDMPNAADQRTIDRIDSKKAYEAGNVVACCKEFNEMKGVLEKDGMIHLPNFQKAVMKLFKTVNSKKLPKKAANANKN